MVKKGCLKEINRAALYEGAVGHRSSRNKRCSMGRAAGKRGPGVGDSFHGHDETAEREQKGAEGGEPASASASSREEWLCLFESLPPDRTVCLPSLDNESCDTMLYMNQL